MAFMCRRFTHRILLIHKCYALLTCHTCLDYTYLFSRISIFYNTWVQVMFKSPLKSKALRTRTNGFLSKSFSALDRDCYCYFLSLEWSDRRECRKGLLIKTRCISYLQFISSNHFYMARIQQKKKHEISSDDIKANREMLSRIDFQNACVCVDRNSIYLSESVAERNTCDYLSKLLIYFFMLIIRHIQETK